jgi:hypothetical protein
MSLEHCCPLSQGRNGGSGGACGPCDPFPHCQKPESGELEAKPGQLLHSPPWTWDAPPSARRHGHEVLTGRELPTCQNLGKLPTPYT